jgi:hypothetical protein
LEGQNHFWPSAHEHSAIRHGTAEYLAGRSNSRFVTYMYLKDQNKDDTGNDVFRGLSRHDKDVH